MASHGLKTLLYIFKDFIKVPSTHFWEHHFQLPIFFALLRTPLPTTKKGPFCAFHAIASSSETQGQLVGSIKCSWWKFTVRSRRAPGHLLLPNQFQKRLNCLPLIGQKKIFLANQRRQAAGWLSCFLSLVPRRSLLPRCPREVWERAGERTPSQYWQNTPDFRARCRKFQKSCNEHGHLKCKLGVVY